MVPEGLPIFPKTGSLIVRRGDWARVSRIVGARVIQGTICKGGCVEEGESGEFRRGVGACFVVEKIDIQLHWSDTGVGNYYYYSMGVLWGAKLNHREDNCILGPTNTQAHSTDLVNSFGMLDEAAPSELRDNIIWFTNDLDPNGPEPEVTWPQWDPRDPKALVFRDGLLPRIIVDDNYRTDALMLGRQSGDNRRPSYRPARIREVTHSRQVRTDWIGKEIAPGMMHNWPWWDAEAHQTGTPPRVPSAQLGLTVEQVSQNQAAVISDPQNHIFVVKNSGFVAYGVMGNYDVLAIVDQTHLPHAIKDHVTGPAPFSDAASSLDIPVNNCAVLQSGNDLELLPAGQHCITRPIVTLHGLYTVGEKQFEMPTKDIFTRAQVPVSLTLYLKEPLKLVTHGYETPYDALRDKTQFILTQIVAHQLRELLDALRTHAMDDLHTTTLGIILKDLAIIDRQFNGQSCPSLREVHASETLITPQNVDRESRNKVMQEEGVLSIAPIKAQARTAEANTEAYSAVAVAKAVAEHTRLDVFAAQAAAIHIKARTGAKVADEFA
ncbi:hypothetical protein EDB85DRAFT_1896295 [Lactarius pseudohatsudake]|nr:hypothetical protein EDB85DRAFT_1896295 [Lactarius pseudohatsudake]